MTSGVTGEKNNRLSSFVKRISWRGEDTRLIRTSLSNSCRSGAGRYVRLEDAKYAEEDAVFLFRRSFQIPVFTGAVR
ncbi:protein of unknown function [Nitrospira defluvii]|uniref:Uncharacterized protein n=1 Tax=Nitrospira defluvii TaxID=330214 RepID=B3U4W6_9BACT|nr:protein of unknown function [Nitrospira defluvii]CBK41278.1 protein of unknown function [Nitrospira defluvii]